MDIGYYRNVLQKAGVLFAPGLSEAEIQRIQCRYGFVFPPDMKDFLRFALPVSSGFINWRGAKDDEVLKSLSWPYEGICFDIERNSFWLEEWGQRPATLEEAFAIAREAVERAPTLIPVNGHRYIPDRPHDPGNPILSVYQTDVIYYGCNLADYLENEFSHYFGRGEYGLNGEIRHVEFWSQLVEAAA
ncbi:MAG: SMI1/KNR4 family protein [Pyrinomonadaceae bacterium]